MVQALPTPKVVEIGSRARSGTSTSHGCPKAASYVGFDIVDGPNVDVLGDAHAFAEHFEPSSIDAVFSLSTFEHLAMPWVVVAQLNRVLRTGGLPYIGSHQTWPLHDSPWDFWRFSSSAWRALLNEQTGFEIVEVAMGDSASIVADHVSLGTENLGSTPASWAAPSSPARRTPPSSPGGSIPQWPPCATTRRRQGPPPTRVSAREHQPVRPRLLDDGERHLNVAPGRVGVRTDLVRGLHQGLGRGLVQPGA